jgi:hypothetical protein
VFQNYSKVIFKRSAAKIYQTNRKSAQYKRRKTRQNKKEIMKILHQAILDISAILNKVHKHIYGNGYMKCVDNISAFDLPFAIGKTVGGFVKVVFFDKNRFAPPFLF